MSRSSGVFLALMIGLGCACLSACGGANPKPQPTDPFAYDRSKALRVKTVDLGRHGDVDLREVTYTTGDGERVPALFATPRRPIACLMYQGGLGSTKEQAAPVWTGAAKLHLATFTIDTRGSGARLGSPPPQEIILNADRLRHFITQTVIDLRRGLDYLEASPACRHRIGYFGFSQGGLLGALLSGEDSRINAAALASITPTWRESLSAGHGPVLPGVRLHPAQFDAAVKTLEPFDAAAWVPRISPRPVMLLTGLQDPLTPVPLALELDAAARQPKEVFFYNGGHVPFQGPNASSVAKRVVAFFVRTLGLRSTQR
jgi:cephalosporin-C deacetylase-like acetyl esterase